MTTGLVANNVSTSKFVNIIPQLISETGSGFELNGLLLTKNIKLPIKEAFRFTTATQVKNYFGSTSSEYAFAVNYFTANTGKTKIPPALLIANFLLTVQAGWIRGALLTSTITEIKAITNGSLNITIGGVALTITGLNFSTANSFSDVATILQTAIRAQEDVSVTEPTAINNCTVTYSSDFNAFLITAGVTDSTGTVNFAIVSTTGTDIGTLFNLTEAKGAIKSDVQSSVITINEFMDNIVLKTQNWISFCKNWAFESSEDLQFAQWNSNKGIRYTYVEYDNLAVDINANSTADFASVLKASDISGTICNYGDITIAAFVMGMIAAINYEVTDGRITLAYKQQDGLTVTCSNDDDYDALTQKGYNCYVRDGSANNTFFGYQKGTITGDYSFADAYINHVWLNDRLQVSIRDLFASVNSLPYNNASKGKIQSAIMNDINTAKNAGVINTEVTLGEEIINQVKSETGLDDVETTLYTQGWLLYIKDATDAQRAARTSPESRFYYVDGGSIQKIDLISTVIR